MARQFVASAEAEAKSVSPFKRECPFMSSASAPVPCRGLDCALFVVRHYPTGSVQFAGCSLLWLGKQSGWG